jgi:membrane protease subunit HflC
MNNTRFGILVGLGLVLVIVGLSAFTVNERELAIKLRFGQVRAAQYEPGLHWKFKT